MICFFCFKQKTAYEMRISDWSSDVCSSECCDRIGPEPQAKVGAALLKPGREVDLQGRGGEPCHRPLQQQAGAGIPLYREIAVPRGDGDIGKPSVAGAGAEASLPRLPAPLARKRGRHRPVAPATDGDTHARRALTRIERP